MTPMAPFELPEEQQRALLRAQRLAWITIAYLGSVVIVLAFVLGSSQAMKTAWIEDLLSFIPPVAFLIACRVSKKKPDSNYPFGYLRATSVGYLCGALALLSMGGYLLVDSSIHLMMARHPTIGTVDFFGPPIWLGFFMIPALVWSGVPVVFLGRAKLGPARCLHDKILYADATMNKADWLTASAAMAGVIGIGFGIWWADAAAAAVISLAIVRDGIKHLRASVGDLMDRSPRTIDYENIDPLPARLEAFLVKEDWIRGVQVRVREEGHVLFADALVVADADPHLPSKISALTERSTELDWRLHDLMIMPVRALPVLSARPSNDQTNEGAR